MNEQVVGQVESDGCPQVIAILLALGPQEVGMDDVRLVDGRDAGDQAGSAARVAAITSDVKVAIPPRRGTDVETKATWMAI